MFCGNCGSKIDDGSYFCPECGAKIEIIDQETAFQNSTDNVSSETIPTEVNNPVKTNVATGKNYKNIGIIAAATVVAIVIILVLIFAGGRNEKTVIEKSLDALAEEEGEVLIDLMPDELVKEYRSSYGEVISKKELVSKLEENMDFFKMVYGLNNVTKLKYNYKITSEEKATGSELKEYNEGISSPKIKEVKTVNVAVEFNADGNKQTIDIPIIIMKIGKNWYLLYSGFMS